MTTSKYPVIHTFKVGSRHTCTITMPNPTSSPVIHVYAEWSHGIPRRLTARMDAEYQAGRNAVIAEAYERLQGRST